MNAAGASQSPFDPVSVTRIGSDPQISGSPQVEHGAVDIAIGRVRSQAISASETNTKSNSISISGHNISTTRSSSTSSSVNNVALSQMSQTRSSPSSSLSETLQAHSGTTQMPLKTLSEDDKAIYLALKKGGGQGIRELMKTVGGQEKIAKFCASNYSQENFKFLKLFDQLKAYEAKEKPSTLTNAIVKQQLKIIVNDFIKGKSDLQLNLSDDLRKTILGKGDNVTLQDLESVANEAAMLIANGISHTSEFIALRKSFGL